MILPCLADVMIKPIFYYTTIAFSDKLTKNLNCSNTPAVIPAIHGITGCYDQGLKKCSNPGLTLVFLWVAGNVGIARWAIIFLTYWENHISYINFNS